ncbi:hypothetical protein FT663_00874 [Candidozyma haemuli var. vulneris]|uniref:Small ribosomal subunit protein uS9m n=1 Tax=Candidozyma haemuli TaxID=45357 RepID=A0A2V1AW00_9ASCO|nr:hypothetical protein CXQ85_004639 [[Candida] haemuloni]KAF3990938.1 hypothetical protein FT662_01995 [[Candida] haemuloni var. vulneris]KAF3995038.1 hypothetical protein FT663_00874 [[Candida] haemuloni var. vulneris]PVH21974.1 hypothetical protein CXQ85_004639 [[Candida] haemuloni]
MSLLRPSSCVQGLRSFSRPFSNTALRLQENLNRPLVPQRVGGRPPPVRRSLPYTNLSNPELERTRVVPLFKTYYGGNPYHDDVMSRLNALLRKHHRLPTRVLSEKEAKESLFISFSEYQERAQSGTRIRAVHYREFTQALNKLRVIETELMPQDVIQTLDEFSRKTSTDKVVAQRFVRTLDEFGRANTVGKRKDAVANISMVRGEGLILVNGKKSTEYFTRTIDTGKLVYPFQVVAQEAQYNVFITCSGGGVSGQAEASMYGIAKALLVFNPLLKPRLRKAGLVTRDNRIVERKKPGKVKARKSPTWVKR